jgi:hypothetical protein
MSRVGPTLVSNYGEGSLSKDIGKTPLAFVTKLTPNHNEIATTGCVQQHWAPPQGEHLFGMIRFPP